MTDKIPGALAVLDDVLRAATFYCDREGRNNRSNYADKILTDAKQAHAAFAELIEAVKNEQAVRCPDADFGSPAHNRWEDAMDRVRQTIAAVEKLP